VAARARKHYRDRWVAVSAWREGWATRGRGLAAAATAKECTCRTPTGRTLIAAGPRPAGDHHSRFRPSEMEDRSDPCFCCPSMRSKAFRDTAACKIHKANENVTQLPRTSVGAC